MITFSSDMKVELVQHSGSDASVLAAMLVSTVGEESLQQLTKDPEASYGRINFLMKNRHGTPFEHASLTFFVKAPIAVFREWQRHRIASYNEVSGRYKVLEPEFYIPPRVRPLIQIGKPGEYDFVAGTPQQYRFMVDTLKASFRDSYRDYEALLAQGIAKEVARGVLPVYLYSTQYVTMNPRSLMNFLSLRKKDLNSTFPSFPMWEIEQCAILMEEEFSARFPLTHRAFIANGSVAP